MGNHFANDEALLDIPNQLLKHMEKTFNPFTFFLSSVFNSM